MVRVFPEILPASFGVTLLMLSLILLLAPYIGGHDFGIFKVPNFPPHAKRALKIIGPIVLIIVVLAHIPLSVPNGSVALCPEWFRLFSDCS